MRFTILLIINIITYNSLYSQNFTKVITNPPIIGFTSASTILTDLDSDGDEDLLISGYNENSESCTKLYTNDGNGNFTENSIVPFTDSIIGNIIVADFDNDNDKDIIVVGGPGSDIAFAKVYINNGMLNFIEATQTIFIGVSGGMVAIADFDNDNDLDISIGGWTEPAGSGAHIKFYRNDGNFLFTEFFPQLGPFSGVAEGAMVFYDADGDGNSDFQAIGGPNPIATSKLYRNDGTGNFMPFANSQFDGLFNPSIGVADVDGDNDPDVLISGFTGGGRMIDLYLNDGMASFDKKSNLPFTAISHGSINFFDFDNDGDQDVLLTGSKDGFDQLSANLYANDGSGNFTEANNNPFTPVRASSVAIGDIDEDGDKDIILTGTSDSGRITEIYINNLISTSSIDVNSINHDPISIYPNPNKDGIFYLNRNTLFGENISMKILSINGVSLYEKKIRLSIQENTIDLRQINLSKGIYIMQLSNNLKSTSFKIHIN